MSDYSNKYVDAVGVEHLWNKAKSLYVRKDGDKVLSDNNYSTAEKNKLASLQNYVLPTASSQTLGGIRLGDGLLADENGVVSTVYNPEMDVDWDDITGLPTTLEGYGITDAATKNELDAVRSSIAKVYKYKGQVQTFEDLENVKNPQSGDTYDVEEDGMNYAWNEDESRWDSLGSSLSVDNLSNEEIDILLGLADSEAMLIAILQSGGKAELTKDLTLTRSVSVPNDVILDLAGHTLTANTSGYALSVTGKLTLKNGTLTTTRKIAAAENGGEIVIQSGEYISTSDVAFSAIGSGSKVFMQNGTVLAREGGIGAFDGAYVQIDGGEITCSDNFTVYTIKTSGRGNNTIVLNGGILTGNIVSSGYEACGVYIANNDSFTMNGGLIVANGGCGLLMRAGNVEINAGTITATTGPNVPGYVGDTTVRMNSSAIIYHESANHPGKEGMSLIINGGTFYGMGHSLEIRSNEATPNITINGGDFTPAIN